MTDLQTVTLRATKLPEGAAWAEGLHVRFPAALARAVARSGAPDGDVRALAQAAAERLRVQAAFTENPPTSARLPVSYRNVPAIGRQAIARLIGRIQRARQASWSRFPGWPIDLSADVAADLAGHPRMTFARTPVLLTHDIDSAEGLANLLALFVPEEEKVGARSANYVVPCAWELDHGRLRELQQRGHEIGVHGYDHANRTPFADPAERQRRLAAGRAFGDRYGATGYRAPSLLRTRALVADLCAHYAYDSSIPTSGGPFPVPNNGCASARPWRLGEIWEIPLTLPRDGSLRFLGYRPQEIVAMWRNVSDVVARSGGIVSILTHCERVFSGNESMLAAYREFLAWIAADPRFEFTRPDQLAARLKTARAP